MERWTGLETPIYSPSGFFPPLGGSRGQSGLPFQSEHGTVLSAFLANYTMYTYEPRGDFKRLSSPDVFNLTMRVPIRRHRSSLLPLRGRGRDSSFWLQIKRSRVYIATRQQTRRSENLRNTTITFQHRNNAFSPGKS